MKKVIIGIAFLLWYLLFGCSLGGDIESLRDELKSDEKEQPLNGPVPGNTIAEKFQWLQVNAQSDTSYIIEVNAHENISPHILYYHDNSNITITIKGVGVNKIINLASNGSMFTIGSGITLILDANITLQGRNDNDASLVNVNGTLIMNTGAIITGNTTIYDGGGVSVYGGGTFSMNGGEISGNTASSGGGVSVNHFGIITMNSGEIIDNTASNKGGGVYSYDSNFIMNNGKIIGNIAYGGGGGVYIHGGSSDSHGTFSMLNGEITGNIAFEDGGGVYVSIGGAFALTGGEIIDNIAFDGGGVHVSHGSFIMEGGEINDNTANLNGGGVSVSGTSGSFTIRNGTIYGNIASSYGGGLYVSYGTFIKTGGTIYGYDINDIINSNVAKNNSGTIQTNRGHMVYAERGSYYDSIYKRKETTAGPGDSLSFNGNVNPPVFSGDWDY